MAKRKKKSDGSVMKFYVKDSGQVEDVAVWIIPRAGKAVDWNGNFYNVKGLFNTKDEALAASSKVYMGWVVDEYNKGEIEKVFFTWYRGQLRRAGTRYTSYLNRDDKSLFLSERSAVVRALEYAKSHLKEEQEGVKVAEKRVKELEKKLSKLKVDPNEKTLKDLIETKEKPPKVST